MKIWKICLIAAQLMLAAGASSGGSSPPPPMDNGMFDGGFDIDKGGALRRPGHAGLERWPLPGAEQFGMLGGPESRDVAGDGHLPLLTTLWCCDESATVQDIPALEPLHQLSDHHRLVCRLFVCP